MDLGNNPRKRKASPSWVLPHPGNEDRDSSEESASGDMGVIKRKNIVKGNEGGLKYICDVCSADITSTVSGLNQPDPFAPIPSLSLVIGLNHQLTIHRFE